MRYTEEADRNLTGIARLHSIDVARAVAATIDRLDASTPEQLGWRHVGLFRHDGDVVVRYRLPPPHHEVEVAVVGDVVLSVAHLGA